MKYLIDSNCFIEPYRGLCPMDVAISFWNKLMVLAHTKDVYVLDKVKVEIGDIEDNLKKWIANNMANQVLPFENDDTVRKFGDINRWANSNLQYTEAAINKFTDTTRADIYLVSYAAVNPSEWTVVSQEQPAPNKLTEIKLPDACRIHGVRCIRFMDMFREMGETY